jgi:hypothetical protein
MKKLENLNIEIENCECVYKFTIGDNFYVGSTKNGYKRQREHYSSLLKNKHYNKYVQNCFNKYNEFKFEVLCYLKGQSISTILEIEKNFINLLKPNLNLCLNPVSPNEKDRIRISNAVKKAYEDGRLINPWTKKAKNVDIYDLFGKLFAKNVSTEEACCLLNVSNRSVINNAIRTNSFLVKDCIVIRTGENFSEILDYVTLNNKKGYSYYLLSKTEIKKICVSNTFKEKMKFNNQILITSKDNLIFKKGYLKNALSNRNIRIKIEELSKELLAYLDEDNLNRRLFLKE